MLSYIGGKSSISKWIIPFIPKDIKTYVENFSGMYWVFLKMNIDDYPNLEKVVYNDFNKLNVNLFKCVSSHLRKSIQTNFSSFWLKLLINKPNSTLHFLQLKFFFKVQSVKL